MVFVELESEVVLEASVSVVTVIPGVVGHWVELSEALSAVTLLEKVISAHYLFVSSGVPFLLHSFFPLMLFIFMCFWIEEIR